MAMELLTNPFTLGLLLGLAIATIGAISSRLRRRALVKENRVLRDHLHTQMSINAKANQAQTEQIATLTKQNENLRISLAALKNRPDKSEQHALLLYDKAIHLMYENAPGFAPAWENALKVAEQELEKASTGLIPWFRKIIRPSLAAGKTQYTPSSLQPRHNFPFTAEHNKSEQGDEHES